MTSNEDRKKLEDNASAYMMFGDLDKPFHRPECECDDCEQWRKDNNRPTHAELAGYAKSRSKS